MVRQSNQQQRGGHRVWDISGNSTIMPSFTAVGPCMTSVQAASTVTRRYQRRWAGRRVRFGLARRRHYTRFSCIAAVRCKTSAILATTVSPLASTTGTNRGSYGPTYGNSSAFLYSGGSLQNLGLGGATAINDSGQIIGTAQTSTTSSDFAFLYSGGSMQNLGSFGGANGSFPYAINSSGQVAGTSFTSGEAQMRLPLQ